jgi:hypothetical protein
MAAKTHKKRKKEISRKAAKERGEKLKVIGVLLSQLA